MAFIPSVPTNGTKLSSSLLLRKGKAQFSPQLPRRVRSRLPHPGISRIQSCADDDGTDDITENKTSFQNFMSKLDSTPLTWAEIPFSSIEEELDAIDEYEREEELKEDDVWPKFLRGAAYEHWGHPQLALAQYSKTDFGSGLRRVPELWERRGYNSFKIGKVGEASAYFDVALRLFQDSCGNELHFVHWFYENFADYVPKRNGPSAAVQRGIVKYCMGEVREARETFLPEIALKRDDAQDAILWFLASSARLNDDRTVELTDLNIVKTTLGETFAWDPKLNLFVDLFFAYGEGAMSRVSEAEDILCNAIKKDEKDDIRTHLYLALYHDAFTGDSDEKNRALDSAVALGSTSAPNDTENFLFCAATNRLSAPPGAKSVEITEKTS